MTRVRDGAIPTEMIVIDYDKAFAKMSQHPAFRNQYGPPEVAPDPIDAPRPRARPGGWNDDVTTSLPMAVGRIYKAHAAPLGAPWMWTLAFWHQEDRSPTHGYEPTREDAMAAFAKSWRRE